MAKFLRNAWYVAAWNDEVSRDLRPRMLLNERVLLYRTEAGEAVAIGNVCPHRFAQLHMGHLAGDAVECGYHGLRFDRLGACVLNPHGNGAIPSTLRVKSYPIVEKFGAIWIWMGDAGQADPVLLPDFSFLTALGFRTIRGYKHFTANYQLIVDNLMDSSHSQFVHASLATVSGFLQNRPVVGQDRATVFVKTAVPSTNVPKSYTGYLDASITAVDSWVDVYWNAPSLVNNRTGITPVGQDRQMGAEKFGFHLVTPETDASSHYFYAHARNFKQADESVDATIANWQKVAFTEQDAPMIEACQEVIGDAELESLHPVMLRSDEGVVRIRRILSQMIEDETGARRVA